MRWATGGVILSVALHVGAAAGLWRIPRNIHRGATSIALAESKKPKKKDDPRKDEAKKVEPPKPISAPEAPARRAAAPKPSPAQNTPPPPPPPVAVAAAPAAQAPSLAGLPDLGLSFGNAGGPGGMAIAAAAPGSAPDSAARTKTNDAPKGVLPKPKTDDDCAEAESKPKPLSVPQGTYTETARSAGVEGKVRLKLQIDESGNVISVTVVQGLGSGLDESAIAAAKRGKFSPAQRCGRAVAGSTVFSMRFALE
ncbi:MAG: energy transducer TonB [Byssovorax sp.]